jgi:hypothetical protein
MLTVLSLTASSRFSSPSPESLSKAEDDEWGTIAGIMDVTATAGSPQVKVFRDYANPCACNFYAEQHAKQMMDFNLCVRDKFCSRPRRAWASGRR